MPRALKKSRFKSKKHKPKIEQELNKTQSYLPRNLQSFKQKLPSGNGFIIYKLA